MTWEMLISSITAAGLLSITAAGLLFAITVTLGMLLVRMDMDYAFSFLLNPFLICFGAIGVMGTLGALLWVFFFIGMP